MVLLSTTNKCFGREIRKKNYFRVLSGSLFHVNYTELSKRKEMFHNIIFFFSYTFDLRKNCFLDNLVLGDDALIS